MLPYSYIEPAHKSLPLPEPKVNGGWYTGTAAKAGGGYGNVAILPESHIFMEKLRETNAPPFAIAHIPSDTRPGNNLTTASYHQEMDWGANKYNIRCIARSTEDSARKKQFNGYSF
jgi:hypothetical protein